MGAEAFCTFAEYTQNTVEVLEVKSKETLTVLLSVLIYRVILTLPAGSQKNVTHHNLNT